MTKNWAWIGLAGLLAPLVALVPTASAQPTADPTCDVNGDGYGDIIFSDGSATAGGFIAAGVMNVRYGGANGVSEEPDEVWHQDTPGVAETAALNDRFGFTNTCGDFDNDGFSDVAVGVPGEDLSGPTVTDAGAVNVFYGSDDGLTADRDVVLHQNSGGVKDPAEAGDAFGSALIVGDFDADGYDDLGIGVPRENVGDTSNAGAVNVIYGSASGLDAAKDDFWHQDKPGVKDPAQAGDRAGSALGAGDFDGDGFDDLAMGVPNENVDGVRDAGAINVIYGSASGLDAAKDDFWHQNSTGIKESAGTDDFFGGEITVGDFENDGFDDLVVGVADEDRGSRTDDGVVHVIHGSGSGLTGAGDELWHQNRKGVKEQAASGDNLGEDVDAADYDGDGFDDLAIGVPMEDVDGIEDAGAVNLLLGSADGLSGAGDELWHQDKTGVMSAANPQEFFGIGMLTDDYDGDGRWDLLIADTNANTATFDANVLYGASSGLTAAGDQYFPLL